MIGAFNIDRPAASCLGGRDERMCRLKLNIHERIFRDGVNLIGFGEEA